MNKTLEFTKENFALLVKQNEEREQRISKLESKVSDLEEENEDLKFENENNSLKATLEMFADPHNWKGNTWSPFEAHVECDYPDMIASRALEAA